MATNIMELVDELRHLAAVRSDSRWSRPVTFAPPASEDEITELEGVVVGGLPDDYKQYLRASRRMELPEISVFSPLQVARMYPALEIPQRLVTGLPDRPVEDAVIPVGGNGGGDLFLMGTRGPSFGAVWFWEHESEEPVHGSSSVGFARRAGSFSEFLAQLRDEFSK